MGKSRKPKCKCCGVVLQIVLYIGNATIWALAAFAVGLGLVVGLSSNTIGTDVQLLDFVITTPATLFIFYGALLLIVCLVGCFASVTANAWVILCYILLMILFIPFDGFLGIQAMMTKDPYNTFLANIKDSEDGYANEDAKRVGIIPIPPTVFWHHLQRRGKCCGLYSYEEWRNTTIGIKYHSVPDSCCKAEYDYEGCGELAWKHPNHYKHSLASILHDRGCIAIFPKILRNDNRYTISIFGKLVASLLILCLLISIVLFIMVVTKYFRPGEGLNNPTFVDAQVEPDERDSRRESDGAGDRTSTDKNNNVVRSRKISFDNTGPRLIPSA